MSDRKATGTPVGEVLGFEERITALEAQVELIEQALIGLTFMASTVDNQLADWIEEVARKSRKAKGKR